MPSTDSNKAVIAAAVASGLAAVLAAGISIYALRELQAEKETRRQKERSRTRAVSLALNSMDTRTGDSAPAATPQPLAALGEAESTENMLSLVQQLEAKNKHLSRQVTLLESTVNTDEAVYGATLSPSEVETVKAIFDMFDTNHDGSISITQVKALHSKLGERLSDSEARVAMKELDRQGNGFVTFEDFLRWWYETSRQKQSTSGYRARFKFIQAKISAGFDISRVVTKKVGDPNTPEFRVTFKYKQKSGHLRDISPWHDVPLAAVGERLDARIFHFICEIPKWTRAKYEIATGEVWNPIKQDTKHGKLRFYKHGDMMFNYGALPQTWESPDHIHPDTKYPGDNDPIDAIEIGTVQLVTGSITKVKVLGVLALIDSEETDWKLIVINIADPLAQLMRDIDDVDTHMPGAINAIRDYLKIYKVCTGSPENSYAMRGECRPSSYAIQVIEDCHQAWRALSERGQKEV